MQQPKNPESATTTTQFFNNEGSTHCACGGRGWFERQIFVLFWARICDVILVQLGVFLFIFFQAPRVERLWAFQKFHQILLASPRSQTAETFVQRLDGGTSMMPKSVKRNEYNNTVDLRSFGGVDAILDVITQCCKLPLHFYSQFFKTHSVCQELVQEPWNDQCRVPRSHHVTHGNRLSWMSPDSNHWEKAWNIAVWQHGATLGYVQLPIGAIIFIQHSGDFEWAERNLSNFIRSKNNFQFH